MGGLRLCHAHHSLCRADHSDKNTGRKPVSLRDYESSVNLAGRQLEAPKAVGQCGYRRASLVEWPLIGPPRRSGWQDQRMAADSIMKLNPE